MPDEVIELNLSDAASSPMASDLWRALIRPLVNEMFYDRIRSVKITRYETLHCRLEIELEGENGD